MWLKNVSIHSLMHTQTYTHSHTRARSQYFVYAIFNNLFKTPSFVALVSFACVRVREREDRIGNSTLSYISYICTSFCFNRELLIAFRNFFTEKKCMEMRKRQSEPRVNKIKRRDHLCKMTKKVTV